MWLCDPLSKPPFDSDRYRELRDAYLGAASAKLELSPNGVASA